MTDAQAIREVLDGNDEAFRVLIQRYQSQVAATVIGMLGSCPEADDVGQETFIRFYRSLNKFRGDSAVGTYLTRIAINLSLNELRRRRHRFGLFKNQDETKLRHLADHDMNPDTKETGEMVRKAIGELEPIFRSVIVLRLIDGYSTDETAGILKIPQGTVLSRLARAQKKLKKIIGAKYEKSLP